MAMPETQTMYFAEDNLKSFCKQMFLKSGLPETDATLVSHIIVETEMRDVSSHGLVRVPFYCRRLIAKGTNPNPKLSMVVDRPSVLLIDGDNGMGQVVGAHAMTQAIQKAKATGICFAGVRNSGHFGMASTYAMLASRQEMIGVSSTNTTPLMTAWGGSGKAIGNNPLAVAVPTGGKFPLVLDISMSMVAGGKVRLASTNKEKIPLDWLLDAQGRPTDNPDDFSRGGTLLPMGGHKGYGLAVILEILTGVITGANILGEIGLWIKDPAAPVNFGHFFIAIDVSALCDVEEFKNRINKLIGKMKSSPISEGSKGIFVPGEIEYLQEQAGRKHGIPISLDVVAEANDFALQIGIPPLKKH